MEKYLSVSLNHFKPSNKHPYKLENVGMYFVYLIECKDKSLYTGITTNVERRFNEHNSGKGGAYTRSKKVKRILYTEQFETRSEAQKREAEIKGWSRAKKLNLIKFGK